MTEITIKPWTNYGHRRGYANQKPSPNPNPNWSGNPPGTTSPPIAWADWSANRRPSVRSCVVALTGTIAPEVKITQMPDGVMALDRMDVPRWFTKRPPVLTSEQVDAIYAVARRSDTWV